MAADRPGTETVGRWGTSFAIALRESLASAVVLAPANEETVSLSREAQRLLGVPSAPAAAVPLSSLPAPLPTLVREALCAEARLPSRPIRLEVAGRELEVDASLVPLWGGDRKQGVLLMLSEVSAERQFEAHLREIHRLANVGTLAAGMAHEIRNALVAGKTYIDLLLEKNQEPELVAVVRRELGRIESIVGRVLKFAVPGGAAARSEPVHVHDILEYCLRLVQPELDDKGIRLEQSFEAATDLTRGDEDELQQAVINLLLNALDALAPGGKLSVRTELGGGPGTSRGTAGGAGAAAVRDTLERPRIRVSIVDDGPGIAPQHLDRVFEPFFTTKANGTGLGLAITRRIIRDHAGTIGVRSQAGTGTTFEIDLPALESEPAPVA